MAPRKNRLASETSPYLLQHATNPVDWYPWGPEALERAQREDKPLLLSVGYSACHWCHVMERECFENESIATLMNRSFVCIKVDREERPDIDDVYMAATIAISGGGGWPMTVFCTPEQTPFFAGTYFPPEDRDGRPGFATLLTRVAELWQNDRDALFRQAGELRDHLAQVTSLNPAQSVSASSVEHATAELARAFDEQWGGFGSAPKFPPTQALHLLLSQHHRTGNAKLLAMVTATLDAMRRGGLYDHIGGGFARYSVDAQWLVPHFEKMLYDNAALARVYLEAHQVTKNDDYQTVVRETLDYIIRDMQDDAGGYYSATDADSEGVEGKYFVFTPKQIRGILEAEETRVFCAYYDISEAGNWEGVCIPNTPRSLDAVAEELRLSADEAAQLLRTAKAKVFDARSKRPAPETDDKILAGWNGLMIGVMAEAGRVLGEPRYIHSAQRAATHLVSQMLKPDGRLHRTTRRGKAHLNGVLEDYAYTADALIDLYEATGEQRWLDQARQFSTLLLSDFLDPTSGAFFQTSHDHEALIVRIRDGNDGALPNAGAMATRALIRLSSHFDEPRLRTIATSSLRAYGHAIERQPRAYLTTLNTAEWLLSGPLQLFFAGSFAATQQLQSAAALVFLPHRTIAYPSPASPWAAKLPVGGSPSLYICRNYSCQLPVTRAEEVAAALSTAMQEVRNSRGRALSLPRVAGHATPEGTHRYFERHLLDPAATRKLGHKDPVLVSRVGFGTYRVSESVPSHQQALLLALRDGCNVIDTAPAYNNGKSERAVGNAIAELQRVGDVQRDEVVLVTKVGMHATGSPSGESASPALGPSAIALDDGSAYCLEPAVLSQQLSESLERLNVECIDVCLLHNPELLLTKLPLQDALAALGEAFVWLEREVLAGRIQRYGVSSNDIGLKSVPLSLGHLVELSKTVHAEHFEVIQLPLNVLEQGARTSGALKWAEQQGLTVLTHRALNTLTDATLRRVYDAPEDVDAPELETARSAVRALEHEFRSKLGAVLRAVPDLQIEPDKLFTWSSRIDATAVSSRELWDEFERGVLGRELPFVVGALNRAMQGKQLGQFWTQWRNRYTDALETCVLAAQTAASRATNQRNQRLREALFNLAPEGIDHPSLAQLAVHCVSSEPGVTSTLVGMREPKYAREITATLRFPDWEDLDWSTLPSL